MVKPHPRFFSAHVDSRRSPLAVLGAVLLIAAVAASVPACSKSDGGGTQKAGQGAAKLTNPNTMSLKSLGGEDQVLIDGKLKMNTVVITPADQQGNPGLWMWAEGGGCDFFKEKGVVMGDKMVKTRVAIIFGLDDEKAQAGQAPLPQKIKPKNSVIFHKGFNRVIMSFTKDVGHVTILSGKLEPGSEVKGRVSLEDNHGRIQGDFIAKVCPRP